ITVGASGEGPGSSRTNVVPRLGSSTSRPIGTFQPRADISGSSSGPGSVPSRRALLTMTSVVIPRAPGRIANPPGRGSGVGRTVSEATVLAHRASLYPFGVIEEV